MGDKMNQVHVHIKESEQLKGQSGDNACDPYVKVVLFDKSECTHIIYDTLGCVWDRTLFFEFPHHYKLNEG